MTVEQKIKDSYEYIGAGTYLHLAPIVTQNGFDAGWRYSYPEMLNLNGVNYSKFTTLDELVSDGIVELKKVSTTLI